MKFLIIIFLSITISNDRMTFEKRIYDNYSNSIFTIFGESGNGTGYLIDNKNGFIATNYHVVDGSKDYIRVLINNETKVKARIIARSRKDDMAIIQVNPFFTDPLKNCILANKNYNLFIGENIYTIGSPLHQQSLLSKGIISKLTDNFFFSSNLNVNSGNSGGPVFNNENYVIGMCTFGDQDDKGDKISGMIKIKPIYELINIAKEYISKNDIKLSKKLFPLMPRDNFPLDSLKTAIYKEYDHSLYQDEIGIYNKQYSISYSTPPYLYYKKKKPYLEAALLRYEKLKENNLLETENIDDLLFNDLYNWQTELNKFNPVVEITVTPIFERTSAAQFGNLLFGTLALTTGNDLDDPYIFNQTEFKGDLYDFNLYKNNKLVTEIERRRFIKISDNNSANKGIYTYSIDAFSPIDDILPNIELFIYDIKKPEKPYIVKIPEKTIFKIWEDFLPYTNEHKKWERMKDCPYVDCTGICNGNALVDCAGLCNGDNKLDKCNICDNDPTNDCIVDCNNIHNGKAYEDMCGKCDDNPSNDCIQDECGIWGGSSYIDECGKCRAAEDKKSCTDTRVLQEIIDYNPQLEIKNIENLGYQKWDFNGRLTSLKINNLKLKKIPASINDLSYLTELSLDNNMLIELPESICSVTSKAFISVSKNKLCHEYHYDCIDYVGKQDQLNCP